MYLSRCFFPVQTWSSFRFTAWSVKDLIRENVTGAANGQPQAAPKAAEILGNFLLQNGFKDVSWIGKISDEQWKKEKPLLAAKNAGIALSCN